MCRLRDKAKEIRREMDGKMSSYWRLAQVYDSWQREQKRAKYAPGAVRCRGHYTCQYLHDLRPW
jgi:hypothetical protein